jgi:hypothetical protein
LLTALIKPEGIKMIITDEFIKDIFPKEGFGDVIDNCVTEKRKYLAKKIEVQLKGSHVGNTIYCILIDSGFIVIDNGKKRVTKLGQILLKQNEEMTKKERMQKEAEKPARIMYTYDEAMKEMFNGEAIYELDNEDFKRIDSHEDLETFDKERDFYSCILNFDGFLEALAQDKKVVDILTQEDRITHCNDCGYSWKTGLDHYHSCLEESYKKLKKEHEKLKIAICIYAREEITDEDFESDKDVLKLMDEHAKSFNYK